MEEYDYSGKWVSTEIGNTLNKKDIRFGKLIANTLTNVNGTLYWNCTCDCGNTKLIKPGGLRKSKYGTKSCGCLVLESIKNASATKTLNLTGQRFGRLSVVGLNSHPARGLYLWNCLCDCGKSTILSTNKLRTGNTRSCGCLRNETTSDRFSKDYCGKRIGKLIVVCYSGKHKGKQRVWKCLCDCGREHYITTASILSGNTKSCGKCGTKEKRDRYAKNIIGQKFGHLTVIERDYTLKDKRAHWFCKCDCGCIVSVIGKHLRNGNTRSCGCVRSYGEQAISEYLLNNNVRFKKQYRFDDCKDIRSLPFDFFLPDYNICIEYDGKQHFEPVDFGGKGLSVALEQYKINISHDAIKTDYCRSNGLTLIRIIKDNVHELDKILNLDSLEKLHEKTSRY